jgi:hypothetical protein
MQCNILPPASRVLCLQVTEARLSVVLSALPQSRLPIRILPAVHRRGSGGLSLHCLTICRLQLLLMLLAQLDCGVEISKDPDESRICCTSRKRTRGEGAFWTPGVEAYSRGWDLWGFSTFSLVSGSHWTQGNFWGLGRLVALTLGETLTVIGPKILWRLAYRGGGEIQCT